MVIPDLDLELMPRLRAVPIWHARWTRRNGACWPCGARAGGGCSRCGWSDQRVAAAPTRAAPPARLCDAGRLFWLALPLAGAQMAADRYPDLSGVFPAPTACSARPATCRAPGRGCSDDQRPWLDHGLPGPRTTIRCCGQPCRSPAGGRCPPTTRSCASRATACTRSRSARCTPASSSRDTSASRWSARRCCGSSSAWATCTRASSSASPSCAAGGAPPGRARVGRFSTVAYAWAYCMALESAARHRAHRAPPGCARCCWSASASPTTWATWARWATTPASPSAGAVLAPARGLAALSNAPSATAS
jgi:hypothetical protein